MAQIKPLGDKNKAYSLANNEEVRIERLIAIPVGREDLTILCVGPNTVYYHTEGNPPGLGRNDNGDIAPNHSSSFTITAATVYIPDVYLHATHGATVAAVFYGDIKLNGNIFAIPDAIQYIRNLFP